ncbi:MAG: hypothetical protein IKU19_01540 [Clostridia bacterium]|nr:hypothetical protein [Clostridia bacterium]
MPYIPEQHKKYDLLPLCREHGGEVFDYPSKELYIAEKLLGSGVGIFPYNYDSYEEYYGKLENLITEHTDNTEIVEALILVRDGVKEMNCKEEWSVLKYLGPTDDSFFGLTHGKNYYWPTRKSNPIYNGVVDDEEFTSYLYPTEPDMWQILEDPTGMAYRTIYEKSKGHMTKKEHDKIMSQFIGLSD